MTAEEACSAYGCLPDYIPENTCQCNEACELYNDCCPDYSTMCINAKCENYGCVADYAPDNLCQCNDACEVYNDCCSDYVNYCINGESLSGNSIYSDYAQNSITYSSILMAVMFTLMLNTIIQYVLLMKHGKSSQQNAKQVKSITSTNDDRAVVLATFISITLYFFCVVCYLVASIALLNTYNDLENETESSTDFVQMKINAETASILFWNFGYGCMQIVLAARLYFTFKQTSYEYSKWVYFILAFIWIVEFVSMIIFHVEREEFDNYLLSNLVVIGLVTHVLFTIIVVGLYTRNLFKITLNRSANLLENGNDTSGKDNNNVDNQRMQLYIDHSTRMSVLTGFAGIFTLVSFVIWLIFFKEEDEAQGGEGVTFEFLNTSWWFLPMDAFINGLCLFLNLPFVFAYDVYSKICFCCHGICNCICAAIVNSMMNKDDSDLTMSTRNNNDSDGNDIGNTGDDDRALMT